VVRSRQRWGVHRGFEGRLQVGGEDFDHETVLDPEAEDVEGPATFAEPAAPTCSGRYLLDGGAFEG